MEERLKFYDTGDAPRKNVDVMSAVAESLRKIASKSEKGSTKKAKKSLGGEEEVEGEKKDKKKKRDRDVEAAEEEVVVDDGEKKKKKKKVFIRFKHPFIYLIISFIRK